MPKLSGYRCDKCGSEFYHPPLHEYVDHYTLVLPEGMESKHEDVLTLCDKCHGLVVEFITGKPYRGEYR
jgi:hypothetical protein